MTREEAIFELIKLRRKLEKDSTIDVMPFDMAIEALKSSTWIPCSERLPEEREWIGTKQFGTTISDEVYVTFESPDGVRFAKHLCFQNGKLSNHDQLTIDAFHKGAVPIAWMPLLEPYKEKDEVEE